MKRSGYLRRTEFKRKPSQLKRTPIRKVSKKRARLMAKVSPERDQYLREHPYCACCNDPSACVHEISCGAAREKSLGERKAWLAVCVACNLYRLTDNGDKGQWPIARQLAAKAFQDPDYFDIERVCILRGRAPGAIKPVEVVRWGRTIEVKYVGEFSDTWGRHMGMVERRDAGQWVHWRDRYGFSEWKFNVPGCASMFLMDLRGVRGEWSLRHVLFSAPQRFKADSLEQAQSKALELFADKLKSALQFLSDKHSIA